MAAQELHDALELVFAAAHDADFLALYLRFGFWVVFSYKGIDLFGLVLIKPLFERNFPSHFKVTGNWLFGGVEKFLALVSGC